VVAERHPNVDGLASSIDGGTEKPRELALAYPYGLDAKPPREAWSRQRKPRMLLVRTQREARLTAWRVRP
jgi:hypothetical protein